MSDRLPTGAGSRVSRQVIASPALVAGGICYDRACGLQEESGGKTVHDLALSLAAAICGRRAMTRWVAIFEDRADDAARQVRTQHAEAHFAYLAAHRDRILIGGGLRPAPGEWYCGGLWVLEVESRAEAVALCEDDPFFREGLRQSYRLYVWGKAPLYGVVPL
jgi:uncharacterized protein YciI